MAGNDEFETLDAFLDDYLDLPVRGADGKVRVYRIEDPPAEDGIRIEKVSILAARLAAGGTAPDAQVLGDEEEKDLFRLCLGEAYDRLLDDGVKWSRFKHVALTAMFWITSDKATAQEYWNTGIQPGKALNRAARRQEKRDSSGSAAANSTRSQGSTSGTRAGSPRRRRGSRT